MGQNRTQVLKERALGTLQAKIEEARRKAVSKARQKRMDDYGAWVKVANRAGTRH